MKGTNNFTLIELLIIIAILGLLMSVLLPSLTKAREAGKRTVCLSNISEWSKGGIQYHSDNGKFWSLWDRPYISTGKSGSWARHTTDWRPVNKYLGYTEVGSEVPAAHCPSDTYYTGQRLDTTAYDLLGSSYCDNMATNTVRRRGGNAQRSLKDLNLAKVISPDKCLFFMEWPIVSQTYRPNEDYPSWHLRQQYFNTSSVDGSARYIQVLVGQVASNDFLFEYDR
ncbi:MAG: hypothetical protein MK132_20870 [Lentisphaerales bacterium]|nr:hypothetical protein [Lentisphaerales bacterium]